MIQRIETLGIRAVSDCRVAEAALIEVQRRKEIAAWFWAALIQGREQLRQRERVMIRQLCVILVAGDAQVHRVRVVVISGLIVGIFRQIIPLVTQAQIEIRHAVDEVEMAGDEIQQIVQILRSIQGFCHRCFFK